MKRRALNDEVFQRSSQKMEANVAEALAEKARDPRLATMTQEDLVYEVLKECFDPEIPLNVVDLGLIYNVQVNPDSVDLKITHDVPAVPLTRLHQRRYQDAADGRGVPHTED